MHGWLKRVGIAEKLYGKGALEANRHNYLIGSLRPEGTILHVEVLCLFIKTGTLAEINIQLGCYGPDLVDTG